MKRRTPAPMDIHEVAEALPAIERELRPLWEKYDLVRLVDRDLAVTLPILARMERDAAEVAVPAGFASWDDVRDVVERRRDQCHEGVRLDGLRNVDFYANWSEGGFLSWVERAAGIQPDPSFRAKQRLERYVAGGVPWAKAVQELRSIGFSTMPWINRLSESGTIRLRYFPLTTGRFGCSSPPLHGIVKRAPFAPLIRSALRAPAGHRIVAADFGAFEPRLIAAITGSPVLNEMARTDDLHTAMAERFLGRTDHDARALAKRFGIALGYGQKRRTFQYKTAELDREDAGRVFDELHRLIPEVAQSRTAGWRT
ncbi:MAG TPA: DNA polymerase, partial [Polyangiaceae bacterium]|nr:DNA polymerase [Polyangiaceae bacterium]